ncbi:hypothetical protein D3C72_1440870 [compost metagenome]
MKQEHITAAYGRAKPVVDGLKKVRDQQARDVVALVGAVAERDAQIADQAAQIDVLQKKVAGLELQKVASEGRAARWPF